jgi:hypothetical protein
MAGSNEPLAKTYAQRRGQARLKTRYPCRLAFHPLTFADRSPDACYNPAELFNQ